MAEGTQDAHDALRLDAMTRHKEVVDRLNAESARSLQELASNHNALTERLKFEASVTHNAVASQLRSHHLAEQEILKGQLGDAVRANAQNVHGVQKLARGAQRMQDLMQQQTPTHTQ